MAHWPFDEGISNIAGDASGNNNVGNVIGPQWTLGQVGSNALDFDGNDYVDVGTLDAVGSALTLSMWVRADSFAISDARIISKAVGTAEQDHYFMLSTISGSGGTVLRFRLKTDGNTNTLIASGGALANNTWTHVTATYDGNTMRLYKDGHLSIVQGVGYPNSDRSHEGAMRIWHTADPDRPGCQTGWLGRAVDSIWKPNTTRAV